MKRGAVLTTIAAILWVILVGSAAQAANVSLSGSWDLIVGSADLPGGAGTDLTSTFESLPGQVALSVTGGGNRNWRVDVSKADGAWPGALLLWVKRTGEGTGAGRVSGGLSYQELGLAPTAFVSGGGNLHSVPLQFKITGVSTDVSSATYSTTMTYTVVDTQ